MARLTSRWSGRRCTSWTTNSESPWSRSARRETTARPPNLIRYQFGNHIGSACLELDDQAQVISYEEYYPYGSTSYQAVSQTISPASKRYRYTRKERDEESGLNYHGARIYAPWLGRWIARDPAGIRDDVTSTAYAANNPSQVYRSNRESTENSNHDLLPHSTSQATSRQPTQLLPAFSVPFEYLAHGRATTVIDELKTKIRARNVFIRKCV